MRYKNEVK